VRGGGGRVWPGDRLATVSRSGPGGESRARTQDRPARRGGRAPTTVAERPGALSREEEPEPAAGGGAGAWCRPGLRAFVSPYSLVGRRNTRGGHHPASRRKKKRKKSGGNGKGASVWRGRLAEAAAPQAVGAPEGKPHAARRHPGGKSFRVDEAAGPRARRGWSASRAGRGRGRVGRAGDGAIVGEGDFAEGACRHRGSASRLELASSGLFPPPGGETMGWRSAIKGDPGPELRGRKGDRIAT